MREIEAVAQINRRNRVKAWGDEGGTRLGRATERSKKLVGQVQRGVIGRASGSAKGRKAGKNEQVARGKTDQPKLLG
jgi:hypothetical protein